MQITRIKQIKDYRIFQNWRQRGNTDFARFNVIYGGNGSGKSTLAALLTEVAKGDGSDGTILTVKDDSQQTREIRKPDEALSVRLCIFNADYVAKNWYKKDKRLAAAVDFLVSEEMLEAGDRKLLQQLYDELLGKDWFMTFPDFESYCKTKDKALAAYEDRMGWAKKMAVNIAKAGYFSSDRTIDQYNNDIWHLEKDC